MTKLVICLTSVRGRSGKDTLIEQLRLQGHEVTRVAFGDVLKEECADTLQSYWNEREKLIDWFHSDMKDVPQLTLAIREIPEGPYKEWLMYKAARGDETLDWMRSPRTPRWHLQQYATDYRRVFLNDPDVWLRAGLKKIAEAPEGPLVVVTDLRQANEYNALASLSEQGCKVRIVRLHRMWFVPGVDDAPYHVTDVDLIGHLMTDVILNVWGNPADMVQQLKGAFE